MLKTNYRRLYEEKNKLVDKNKQKWIIDDSDNVLVCNYASQKSLNLFDTIT